MSNLGLFNHLDNPCSALPQQGREDISPTFLPYFQTSEKRLTLSGYHVLYFRACLPWDLFLALFLLCSVSPQLDLPGSCVNWNLARFGQWPNLSGDCRIGKEEEKSQGICFSLSASRETSCVSCVFSVVPVACGIDLYFLSIVF